MVKPTQVWRKCQVALLAGYIFHVVRVRLRTVYEDRLHGDRRVATVSPYCGSSFSACRLVIEPGTL